METVLLHKQKQRTIILLLGILTGAFVLGTSSFYYQIKTTICNVEACVIEESTKELPAKVVVSAYDAVSQFINVNLDLPVLLSFGEVSNTTDQELFEGSEFKERLSPFLVTLFRKIISPNAP